MQLETKSKNASWVTSFVDVHRKENENRETTDQHAKTFLSAAQTCPIHR